ncbi:preprotein translocase subunit SecG [Boudabousia marimammalium]|uniref:Protein-export membrane protein SecG n=1 Tax=Boudabousia marimammalium TaxID=156892 RepID=A0A1Q5PRH6_9ACTO|nr:preprotein translocase subunit SecG [Boudabousia marimammalium]OKL50020.1 preprotein translocase subunit SecG [Boudabousia marimammalium]
MDVLILICQILVFILSLILIGLVLLSKGNGSVSDMFGGGVSSTAASSGVAARNLRVITVTTTSAWVILIILLGVLIKFAA